MKLNKICFFDSSGRAMAPMLLADVLKN